MEEGIGIKEYMEKQFTELKELLGKIEKNLESNYVRKEEFTPVKNIVYGLVGLILVTVVVALLALIIK